MAVTMFFLSAGCGPSKRVASFKLPATDTARALAMLHGQEGDLVFSRHNEANDVHAIYFLRVGDSQARLLAENGNYPRWSPDGHRIAFLRDHAVMIMDADGSNQQELARLAKPHAIAFNPNGREVLYTDAKGIYAVDVSTKAIREVMPGEGFLAVDAARECDRLVYVWKSRVKLHYIYSYDRLVNEYMRVDDGCSASFSPDGEQFLDLGGNHRFLAIRDWNNGKNISAILDGPAGLTIDNDAWSNDPDLIVARAEQSLNQDIYLFSVSAKDHVRITGLGDCDRPDLHVVN